MILNNIFYLNKICLVAFLQRCSVTFLDKKENITNNVYMYMIDERTCRKKLRINEII